MTTSSTTSGELAKPQPGISTPASAAASRDHTTAPRRRVERVQDAGRAERVDAAVVERRRGARAGAAVRLPEPDRVAVPPDRLAGVEPVAGDHLVLAALLLRVDELALDREGRPAGADRAAPQLDRRRCRPVGLDPHAADDAVAIGSAEAGPVGLRGRRRRRAAGPRVALAAVAAPMPQVEARSSGRGCGSSRRLSPRAGTRARVARGPPGPAAAPRASASTANGGPGAVAADSAGAQKREHGAPEQERGTSHATPARRPRGGGSPPPRRRAPGTGTGCEKK